MPLWDTTNKKPIYYPHDERVQLTNEGWVDTFTHEILVAIRDAYDRKDLALGNYEFEDGTNILLDSTDGEIEPSFMLLD